MLSLVGGEFAISSAKSSWTVSSSTMGMAIDLFFLAFKADEISRKNLMVISSLLTILSGLVFNFSLLIILNLIKVMVLAGVSSVV